MLERNSLSEASGADAGVFADVVRRMVEGSPSHEVIPREAHRERSSVSSEVVTDLERRADGSSEDFARSVLAAAAAASPGQLRPHADHNGPMSRRGPCEQARIPPRYRAGQRSPSRSSSIAWCPWARARCGDLGALLSLCFACGTGGAVASAGKPTHRQSSAERHPGECGASRAGRLPPKLEAVQKPCNQHARATSTPSVFNATHCEDHSRTGLDVDISAISDIKEAEARFGTSLPCFEEQGGAELFECLQQELAWKTYKVHDEPCVDPALPPMKPPKPLEDDLLIGTAAGCSDDSESHSAPEATMLALTRAVSALAADQEQRSAAEVIQRCRAFCSLDALKELDERRQRDLMLLLPSCKAIKLSDGSQHAFAQPALSLSDALASKGKVPSEAASWGRSKSSTSSGPTCDLSSSSDCSSDSEVDVQEHQYFSARITDGSSGSESARKHSSRHRPPVASPKNVETAVLESQSSPEGAAVFRPPITNLKGELFPADARQPSALATIATHSVRRQQSTMAPTSSSPDGETLWEDTVAPELDHEARPLSRRTRSKTIGRPPARRGNSVGVQLVQGVGARGSIPRQRFRPPVTKNSVSRLPDAPAILEKSDDSCSFGYGSSDSGVQHAIGRSPSLPPRQSGKTRGSDAQTRARSSEARQHQHKPRSSGRTAPIAPLAPWEEPSPTQDAGRRRGSKPRARKAPRRSQDSSSRGSGTPRESRFPPLSWNI